MKYPQIANSDCFVCCFEYVAAWNKVTKLCACVCVFAYILYCNISSSRGRIRTRFSKRLPWQIRIIQTAAVRNSETRSQRWGRVTTQTSQLNGGEVGPSFRHSKKAEGGRKERKKSVEAATARVHVHISASARGGGSQSVLMTKLVSPSAGQMEDVLCVSFPPAGWSCRAHLEMFVRLSCAQILFDQAQRSIKQQLHTFIKE